MESEKYGYCLTPLIKKTHSQPEFTYTIESNSYGFRGKEPNLNADFRVLVLGDSFGMGIGVGEGRSLCDLSQLYFNNQGLDIDIFNTSLAGYCSINHLKVLKKLIVAYKPNLVILLFGWNDIYENEKGVSLNVHNGYLVSATSNKLIDNAKQWLNMHSRFYCLIKKFYYLRIKGRFTKQHCYTNFPKLALENTANYLLEMKQVCEANNTLFMSIIPPLHIDCQDNIVHLEIRSFLIDRFKKRGMFFKDWSLLVLRKESNSLIYPMDRHWTEKGHLYFSKHLTKAILTTLQDN